MIERKSGLSVGYQPRAERAPDEIEKAGRVLALYRGKRRPADIQRQPLPLDLCRTHHQSPPGWAEKGNVLGCLQRDTSAAGSLSQSAAAVSRWKEAHRSSAGQSSFMRQ